MPPAPWDLRLVGFSLLLSTLTALLVGLAPACRAARFDLSSGLRGSAPTLRRFIPAWTGRRALVLGQTAISVVLLVGAGLCLRSIINLNAVRLGLEPSRLLLCSLDLDAGRYPPQTGLRFYDRLLERVRTLPGVEAASLSRNSILGPDRSGASITAIEDYTPAEDEVLSLAYNVIAPMYFKTLGLRLLQGREFNSQDTPGSLPVCIASESLAKKYWPTQDPIGRRITLPDFRAYGRFKSIGLEVDEFPALSRVVVGVVADTKYGRLAEAPYPMVYWPLSQHYESQTTLHVRASHPSDAASAVREELRALSPDLPLYNICTLAEQRRDSLFRERMITILLTAFGGIGLLVTLLGLYGSLTEMTRQRTGEFGVRLALGARRSDLFRAALWPGMITAALGLAAGLLGALFATRALRSFLYGVGPDDLPTFLVISLLAALAALLACWFPARRAARMNPVEVLRHE